MHLTVGITGASGAVYGYTMLRRLAEAGVHVSAVVSETGLQVMQHECGVGMEEIARYGTFYDNGDLFAPIASGSVLSDGMVIAPCSMNTLGCIAGGLGHNLITRAAAVTLKENRPLVLVVRETPLSVIALENMCRLAKADACILPACPGFYHQPTEIGQLVDSVVVRALDQFRIVSDWSGRWQGKEKEGSAPQR